MGFQFAHNNINVSDLERSLNFYRQALDLRESSRKETETFTLVYLEDGVTSWRLELTWLKDHPQPYDLGENEIHLALTSDDYAAAHERHTAMGCICYENPAMGIYFIEDPDGYWIEILPERR